MNWENITTDEFREYLLNILKPHGFALNRGGAFATSSEQWNTFQNKWIGKDSMDTTIDSAICDGGYDNPTKSQLEEIQGKIYYSSDGHIYSIYRYAPSPYSADSKWLVRDFPSNDRYTFSAPIEGPDLWDLMEEVCDGGEILQSQVLVELDYDPLVIEGRFMNWRDENPLEVKK